MYALIAICLPTSASHSSCRGRMLEYEYSEDGSDYEDFDEDVDADSYGYDDEDSS